MSKHFTEVYIAVMDYCSAAIKLYKVKLPIRPGNSTYDTDDVELWLEENTDYTESQCYYMSSADPIEVEDYTDELRD